LQLQPGSVWKVQRRLGCGFAAAVVATAGAASAHAQAPSSPPAAIRSKLEQRPHGKKCKSPGPGVVAGGRCRWTTAVDYYVVPHATSAKLILKDGHDVAGRISVFRVGRSGKLGIPFDERRARSPLTLDVLAALPPAGGRVRLLLRGDSTKKTTRFGSVTLRVTALSSSPVSGSAAPFGVAPAPAPADPGAGASPVAATDVPDDPAPVVAPPTNGTAVWVSRDEVMSRPATGPLWDEMQQTANATFPPAKIADQDSNHDMYTLAAALVYARSGAASYRAKTADAIKRAIGTESNGYTLALGRNLAGYVVAADLIDLKSYNSTTYGKFRSWLSAVRNKQLHGLTLITTHERRSNNWGAMAGASRIAADLYLGDTTDLARAATVFRGYLGDRSAYKGFEFGDMSWQANPSAPVPINPAGATKDGFSIDGALPDDMRRGCAFQVPPCPTWYAWEAMQGIIMQADLLSHHGYPAFAWSDMAVYRAAHFLRMLDRLYGGWWAQGDDIWQPSVLNHAYGPVFPSNGSGAGKVFGWTNWVYGT
jgi:hypothetical protein